MTFAGAVRSMRPLLVAQFDTRAEGMDGVAVWQRRDERVILLLDAEARVHDAVRYLAIIRHQQQPLGVPIEPPDGHDALLHID